MSCTHSSRARDVHVIQLSTRNAVFIWDRDTDKRRLAPGTVWGGTSCRLNFFPVLPADGAGKYGSPYKMVTSSYDALLELFECLGNFLKRLEIYTAIPPTPIMTEIIVKIMVQLLSVLALASKQIKQGRFSEWDVP